MSSEDGESVATQLISVLVAEHLSATGGCWWTRCLAGGGAAAGLAGPAALHAAAVWELV